MYGGVEVQMLGLRDQLKQFGIKVKLFDMYNDSIGDYDILHMWRPLGNPLDALNLANIAKKNGVKVVVSPIYWKNYNWEPVLSFEEHRIHFRLKSLLRNMISSFVQRGRSDLGFDSIHWFHRYVLRNADLLLPNSWNEGHLLVDCFKVDSKKIHPVPIGVDEKFARAKPDKFVDKYGINDFLLFVGRVERRKNVLNLIKAYKRTRLETELVVIGDPSNKEYLEECLKATEGDKNVIFCGFMPHDSDLLSSAYAAAKALILPSWYETPGIVALEAGLAGANIAITKIGGTTEYFKSLAFYIDPYKMSSIEKALVESQLKEKTSDLREHILNNYTMEKVAKRYIEAYEKTLI